MTLQGTLFKNWVDYPNQNCLMGPNDLRLSRVFTHDLTYFRLNFSKEIPLLDLSPSTLALSLK